jgi:non-ribosomal peptide synthase protein (TIGR01720 family)
MQPAPVGVVGELYLGGAGLARGYLNRPGLTADKFVPDPFGGEPGSRLYATGDLGRWLADGTLDFLGRVDHQVKVRGFRIELGEIEAALERQDGVRQAVVVARQDRAGDPRLVAYVIPHDGATVSPDALREGLRQTLPEYMVPGPFMVLGALPLTPSGKVDRKALPAPDVQAAHAYTPPRTPAEQTLADLWAQILGVPQVGIHDNFFALGGDSILGIQVVARAAQQGLRLSPRLLFQHQTIAELAQAALSVPETRVHVEQVPVEGEVPLTPIQHWFFQQQSPAPHHANLALLLAVDRPIDPGLLRQSLLHLVQHHDALRLRFRKRADQWQQVHGAAEGAFSVEQRDLSTLPEHEQGPALESACAQVQASLCLEDGPLMRAVLFDLGAGRPGRFLLVIHHLVVDPVSWHILLEDLLSIYQALAVGTTVRLPAKTTSWQQWAVRLAEHARSELLRQELPYWLDPARQQVLPLPVDHHQGEDTVGLAERVEGELDEGQTQALLTRVPAVYHTQINDALLAALLRAVTGWMGHPRLLVNLEGHGRQDLFAEIDLSRTVGWFAALYPVLLEWPASTSPGEALTAVKEQLRRVPNGGIGYGLLRYLSGDPELVQALDALPQAQVCFNYLGQLDRGLPPQTALGSVPEWAGQLNDPHTRRSHLLEVTCHVSGGRFRVTWSYGPAWYRRQTVEALARAFLQALEDIIGHCRATPASPNREELVQPPMG